MTQGVLYVSDANGNKQGIVVSVDGSGNLNSNIVITDESGNRVKSDAQNNLGVQNGGRSSSLNNGVAVAIKATPGRLRKIIIIAPGSASGAFTFNDCATVGAAAAANEIFTLPYNAAANVAGAIFVLDWPCAVGITLSAVPGAGSPVVAVAYD